MAGPWVLDLGDVLYAPTVFTDAQGRLVMLAWMQELRSGQGRLYAGCLSVPRLLTLRGTPLLPAAQNLGHGASCSCMCMRPAATVA